MNKQQIAKTAESSQYSESLMTSTLKAEPALGKKKKKTSTCNLGKSQSRTIS